MTFALLIAIGIGSAIVMFMAHFWMGLPFFLLALLKRKPVKASLLTLSSVQAIFEARTVYEFIDRMKNDLKRSTFKGIMDEVRKLILDIRKHRENYPKDINELVVFVNNQLRYRIADSAISNSVEASKFRDLSEKYINYEVGVEIHKEDLKSVRVSIPRRKIL